MRARTLRNSLEKITIFLISTKITSPFHSPRTSSPTREPLMMSERDGQGNKKRQREESPGRDDRRAYRPQHEPNHTQAFGSILGVMARIPDLRGTFELPSDHGRDIVVQNMPTTIHNIDSLQRLVEDKAKSGPRSVYLLTEWTPGNEEPVSTPGNMEPVRSVRCSICGGEHQTKLCIVLNGTFEKNDRRQGFKWSCPFHKNANHILDDCQDLGKYVNSPKLLVEALIQNCFGPPYATQLIHWPDLLATNHGIRITRYPWTPEFSIQQWEQKPEVLRQWMKGKPIVLENDPSTDDDIKLWDLAPQTIDGSMPPYYPYELPDFLRQKAQDQELQDIKKSCDDLAAKSATLSQRLLRLTEP
ncbi:hypothetical protein F4779DRAFT_576781 [Xylariaceae sp. FL0662B]|nr:hypothetical protein F4779DRAFT_576781 [Xylariaceae sp. FL0662B]